MAIKTDDVAGARMLPRTLAGATVLQIIPALRESPVARATIDIAQALVRAGARAIVAAERGPLVNEIKSFGAEWLPFASTTVNPFRIRRNADRLETFVADERVDIVHAKSAGAAWSALIATDRDAARLVTDLPDLPRPRMRLAALYLGSLSRGDRVIARSLFNARPMIERYHIPEVRLTIIPRSIDTTVFDPGGVHPQRVAALRNTWGVPSGARIVMTPGRVAPWNGQIHLVNAAAALRGRGFEGVTFVLVGDDRRDRRYGHTIRKKARQAGIEPLFRIVGHVDDMPAAYAAADIVVVPCVAPPVYGRVVAEAQAMARPVIASSIGPLPENLLTPPRMPNELRTGWLVQPANEAELADTLAAALALDAQAYRALAARARQFGEFMFSPQRVAAATLAVYSSLLETGEQKTA
jgi:glycosyltransferase involved in cell wall biosynthesis